MEKTRRYRGVRFDGVTLRKGLDEFKGRAQRNDEAQTTARYRVSRSREESWSYDDEGEFFEAYERGFESASCAWNDGRSWLEVQVVDNDTTISVSLSDRQSIVRVFDIFEKAATDLLKMTNESTIEDPEIAPAQFSVRWKVPSCDVDKELIERLEEYVLTKVPDLVDFEEREVKRRYEIAIEDDTGTETMGSIRDYSGDKFTDSTEAVSVSLRLSDFKRNEHLVVEIEFASFTPRCGLTLRCEMKHARERGRNIQEGILRLIDTKKNRHYAFHGSIFSNTMYVLGMITLALALLSALSTAWANLLLSLSALAAISVLWIVSRVAHPYIAFDTVAQRSRATKWKYWVGGVGMIMIAEVIAYIARRTQHGGGG